MKLCEVLSGVDLDRMYDIFSDSYNKSVGVSWSREKFMSRARNWEFHGDESGFVATRSQRGGLLKLVGSGGNSRGILRGIKELLVGSEPVWGFVSSDILGMATKLGFISPPSIVIKGMMKIIPSSAFGDVSFVVNGDGSVTFSYDDVGDARKYFIGSKSYFKFILDNFGDRVGLMGKPVVLLMKKLIGESYE